MSTLVSVARYHLMDRVQYVLLPIIVTAASFLVNVVIFAVLPDEDGGGKTGGLATLYVFLFGIGVVAIMRALPFALTLGMSRRTFYLGTLNLTAIIAVVSALVIVALQAIERATGGWGIGLHFFRISWFLSGPWYETLATALVAGAVFIVYGIWYGLVFRLWGMAGVVAFVIAQLVVFMIAILAIAWTDAWSNVHDFFTDLSALGLTGLLAALTAAMAVGGYATIRRIAV